MKKDFKMEYLHWKLFKIWPLITKLAMVWIKSEKSIQDRVTANTHTNKKTSDKSAHEETAAIPPHQQSGQRRKSQDAAKIQRDSSVCSADIF